MFLQYQQEQITNNTKIQISVLNFKRLKLNFNLKFNIIEIEIQIQIFILYINKYKVENDLF